MVLKEMPFRVWGYGQSEIGLVRQNNEDVWAELPEIKFFVLADGMGGHAAGEVAARELVTGLLTLVQEGLEGDPDSFEIEEVSAILENAIEHMNYVIFKMGKADYDLRGMGTTLCCLLFHSKGLVYAHVGDSRIYRLRHGNLQQLTKDDSLLRELVDLGQLDETQATDFLYKNIITKAIGTEPTVEPSVNIADLADEDLFLMCTDGLSDLLNRSEMETILKENGQDLQQTAKELIHTALDRGGHDNITVVLIKVNEIHEKKHIPGQQLDNRN